MAAGSDVREQLEALLPGEHSKGIGRCPACGARRLRVCSDCGERSMHTVGAWSESREDVCENGCTQLTRSGYVVAFTADMKEALYQFERRFRRKGRRH